MKIALHWFRRDLRLSDNTALWHAAQDSDLIYPLFIFDPKIFAAPDLGAARVHFLLESLQALQKNLEVHQSQLTIRQGDVLEELEKVVLETQATAIYWNRDYEPYARERDSLVSRKMESLGLQVHTYKDGVILEPSEVCKADGTTYVVFTPYSKLWRTKAEVKVLGLPRFKKVPADLPSLPMPTLGQLGFSHTMTLPPGGERAGIERLRGFIADSLLRYGSQRNFPIQDGTSRISADLRFGTLSPRQVLAAAQQTIRETPAARAEVDVFISELIWREFYRQILWHYPQVASSCFKPKYNDLKWENNERLFTAWCEGRTGFPIVDAAMRQLNQTGWMHNRLRMIVSSFLTKDLLVSWQWGERYFMQKLVDGDLASNNGGWQWSASTGTDAQPYFRIFNPIAQAEKFDPQGRFIERYVPEANTLSYPPPIIDHGQQRLKALQLFKILA
jgi:deoxyribodipyrimidine photo-lyase